MRSRSGTESFAIPREKVVEITLRTGKLAVPEIIKTIRQIRHNRKQTQLLTNLVQILAICGRSLESQQSLTFELEQQRDIQLADGRAVFALFRHFPGGIGQAFSRPVVIYLFAKYRARGLFLDFFVPFKISSRKDNQHYRDNNRDNGHDNPQNFIESGSSLWNKTEDLLKLFNQPVEESGGQRLAAFDREFVPAEDFFHLVLILVVGTGIGLFQFGYVGLEQLQLFDQDIVGLVLVGLGDM